MIDTYYRARFQRLLVDPALKRCANFSPTTVTLAALAVGLAVPCCLVMGWKWLALICLATSGYLDILDGSLARHRGKSSAQGAVLDILSDRAVEFGIIMGLCFVDSGERALYCLWMLGSVLLCVSSFLVVGIFEQNGSEKSFHYSPGIMERTEAFIFFAVMIAWPASFYWLAPLFTLLVFATAALRVGQFLRAASR